MLIKDIRIIQKVELIIMHEIDRLCKAYNIEYFLIDGTLLGAVRNQGFIPWDDDIDIGMTVDNYKKFRIIASENLGKDFYFQALEDESDYSVPCAKVRIRHTNVVEKFSENVDIDNGIWVDIFCFDLVPSRIAYSKIYNVLLRVAARLNLIKHNYSPSVLTEKRISIFVNELLKYFPISKRKAKVIFEKLLYSRIGQNNNDTFVERDNMFWGKFVFPYDVIYPLITISFENEVFSCPNKPDEYLSQAYGNYMELPPVEERKGHLVESVYVEEKFFDLLR